MLARRRVLKIVGASVLVARRTAEAQQAKVYRVGVLFQLSPPPPGSQPGPFLKTLNDLGFIEGRNIVIDRRFADGKSERFPGLVAELVALKPDVIVADTTLGTMAAMQATTTIPIVMVNVTDPVGSRLIASLSRPGGNVTGVSILESDAAAKRVGLMHAVVPKATRLAVLMTDNPGHRLSLKAIQDAARGLGLTVVPILVRSPEEIEDAFASMRKQRVGALIVLGGPPLVSTSAQRAKVIELAAKTKLPTSYTGRSSVLDGGLLSYGPVNPWPRAATYVDKILRGAKPGDLPVEQPTEFDLAINLKTAKALGVTIPPWLLLSANYVIE